MLIKYDLRFSHIGVIDGVDYIDDSKATNLTLCRQLLNMLPDGKVILLCGEAKCADLIPTFTNTAKKIKALVILGVDHFEYEAAGK